MYTTHVHSPVYAMSIWPCVCPSQASVLSKRLNISSWFSVQRIHSAYLALQRCEVIHISPKIRELPPGTLFQTLNSRFSCFVATARRQLQVFSISSTVASSSHWAGRPSSFMLILHYFDLLWICCGRCPVRRRRLRLVLIMPDCRMFLLTRWPTDTTSQRVFISTRLSYTVISAVWPPGAYP